MNSTYKEIYDFIYIGSSPVLLLDALNESMNNKKILVIDKSQKIGGAWQNLELFNYNRVENAVHYLIFNQIGYRFLEKTMDLELKDPSDKFYALKFLNYKFLISVNKFYSYFLFNIFNMKYNSIQNIVESFRNFFYKTNIRKSKYFKYGSFLFLEKIKNAIYKSSIKLNLGFTISKIDIKEKFAYVYVNEKVYKTRSLILSHGFIPPNKFIVKDKKITLNLKRFRRPSLHIKTRFSKNNSFFIQRFSQVIFPTNSSIKYSHYLNDYFEDSQDKYNNHIVVAALNHNFNYSYDLCCKIAKELESYKLIPLSKCREEADFFWQDILLPQIDNEDLEYLRKISCNIIKPFITEEICSSIGKYSLNWYNLNKGTFV